MNDKSIDTLIICHNLAKQAPRSPRDRIAGFVIACRAVDKCRATIAGTRGAYQFDCPLDNQLFTFKGITGEQFKTVVQSSTTYDQVGDWLLANGTLRTPDEIRSWSDEIEASSPMQTPQSLAAFVENCNKLGLNPEKSTTFDWLEADDRMSFSAKPV